MACLHGNRLIPTVTYLPIVAYLQGNYSYANAHNAYNNTENYFHGSIWIRSRYLQFQRPPASGLSDHVRLTAQVYDFTSDIFENGSSCLDGFL